MSIGIIAIVCGAIMIITGALINASTYAQSVNQTGEVFSGVLSIIEGAVIWWVTRIKIKKTP